MQQSHPEYPVGELHYSIFDPTGNITALVESSVAVHDQPAAARAIMSAHPEVEQVGFVHCALPARSDAPVQGSLRMAGGEFCGNATMCAAAWWYQHARAAQPLNPLATDAPTQVVLTVSGVDHPVTVLLDEKSDGSFAARVHMPQFTAIELVRVSFEGTCADVALVNMPGISHVVINEDSALFWLCNDHAAAERAIRAWCTSFHADGLGLMFVSHDSRTARLTPLVFVPDGDTIFWENSCASGTSAVGMYLATTHNKPIDVTLSEPGGDLRVTSNPHKGETWLYGTVRLCATYLGTV